MKIILETGALRGVNSEHCDVVLRSDNSTTHS